MHSLAVDCDAFSNGEKVAVVVPVAGVDDEVTGSRAMFAQRCSILSLKCMIKTALVSTKANRGIFFT